jgi:ABC-type phosphate transport system substrate-binding protein
MKLRSTATQLALLFLMLFGAVCGAQAQAKYNDVAIIVNPSAPVSDLSLSDARKIFRGDKQYWRSDLPVVLLIRTPPSRERDIILKKLYDMTESEFKQYWIAKIFRAEATTGPKIVYSNSMAVDLVSVLPGAIAFVAAKDVTPNLKVVKIDGHLPGEANYPLR